MFLEELEKIQGKQLSLEIRKEDLHRIKSLELLLQQLEDFEILELIVEKIFKFLKL